jgi:hypothetical protein
MWRPQVARRVRVGRRARTLLVPRSTEAAANQRQRPPSRSCRCLARLTQGGAASCRWTGSLSGQPSAGQSSPMPWPGRIVPLRPRRSGHWRDADLLRYYHECERTRFGHLTTVCRGNPQAGGTTIAAWRAAIEWPRRAPRRAGGELASNSAVIPIACKKEKPRRKAGASLIRSVRDRSEAPLNS